MPSGDSISRYDSSMEMFSVKATPIQMKKSQKIKGPSGKDTIEAPKVKKEHVHYIMSVPVDGRASKERAVKIARAGRFIFFVVALPPYLLLYSLPKWVALTVIPTLLAPIEKGFQHAKNFINKVIRFVTEGGGFSFRNILGRIAWKSKGIEKQNNSLLSYMKLKGADFVLQAKKLFKAVEKAVEKAVMKVIVNPVAVAREKLKLIAKEAEQTLEKVVDKVSQSVTVVYETLLQPVVNVMIPKVAIVQEYAELGLKWGKEKLKLLVNTFKEVIAPSLKSIRDNAVAAQKWLTDKAAEISHKTIETVQQIVQIAQPVINLFVPALEFLKKHLSFGLRWLRHKPKEHLWNFHLKVQKFIKGAVPFLDNLLEGSYSRVSNAMGWLLAQIVAFLKRCFPFVPWLFRKIKLLFTWLIRMAKQKCSSLIHTLLEQAKKLLEAPVAYLLGIVRKILKLGVNLLKFAALLLIGAGLVLKYWLQMLYELADTLGPQGRSRA